MLVVQITFEQPDEYLVQVRGTTGRVPSQQGVVVTSITFVSNKRTYGPYGSASGGEGFESVRHENGRVVGIFGRATSCVHSIGFRTARVEELAESETVVVQEAWGGQGGAEFYDGGGDVTEVVVSYNDRHVVSLQATYKRGGQTFKGVQHGGENGRGDKEAKVRVRCRAAVAGLSGAEPGGWGVHGWECSWMFGLAGLMSGVVLGGNSSLGPGG